ncbi:ficolin-2-like [Diadema antillarum]|uniref:ficolin-2-like n=1 Tax=Diadema antillarum TaxID=105358 RepID=UPI003A88BF98
MEMTMHRTMSDCSCEIVRKAMSDIRETRNACIDVAGFFDNQDSKVQTLEMAVEGLASMIEQMQGGGSHLYESFYEQTTTNAPKSTTTVQSTSTSGPQSDPEEIQYSSSINSESADNPGSRFLNVEVPPSLQGIHFVMMDPPDVLPRDCLEVQQNVANVTGVYTILPDGCGQPFQVYCDMEADGGGWTVFQRRQDGSVDFEQNWGAYRRGFGHLLSEFWMGLDKMSRLTAQDDYELRIDVMDFNGTWGVAEYETVRISDYWGNFRLNIGEFKANGTAGDSLSYHQSMPFTTYDRDNDLAKANCGEVYPGGWWYNSCLYSNLNGRYLGPDNEEFARGVTWYEFGGFYRSLKFSEIKVRPR